MPRTFLVERTADMTSSIDNDVADDVTDRRAAETTTSQQQQRRRDDVAMETSVVDDRRVAGQSVTHRHYRFSLDMPSDLCENASD